MSSMCRHKMDFLPRFSRLFKALVFTVLNTLSNLSDYAALMHRTAACSEPVRRRLVTMTKAGSVKLGVETCSSFTEPVKLEETRNVFFSSFFIHVRGIFVPYDRQHSNICHFITVTELSPQIREQRGSVTVRVDLWISAWAAVD